MPAVDLGVVAAKVWTVAVPVYNAVEVTRRSIEYLLLSGVPPALVTLWDDGSTDPLWRDLRDWSRASGCAYRRSNVNLGYTVAVNRALNAATGAYVLLMNSDCVIGRDSIQALVDTADMHPAIAAIGPLSNSAGFQSLSIRTERCWESLDHAEIATAASMLNEHLAWKFGRRPFVVPSVNGFCALWRRTAIEEVGSFDEINFRRGDGEEDDLCFRLTSAGWFCAVAPWVFAVHLRTQSFSAAERTALKADALPMLEELHGVAFVSSVISHLNAHPLLRQIATETVDG